MSHKKLGSSDLTSFQRGHWLAWVGRFSKLRFMEYLSWSPSITYIKKRKLFISCSALVLLSSGFLKLGIPPETNRSAFNFRRVVFFPREPFLVCSTCIAATADIVMWFFLRTYSTHSRMIQWLFHFQWLRILAVFYIDTWPKTFGS